MYSLVQLVSILEQELQEGIILKSPHQTSPTAAYGSVLQPPGMEREELRVYNYLLLVVFIIVIFTCFLLVIGICKVMLSIHLSIKQKNSLLENSNPSTALACIHIHFHNSRGIHLYLPPLPYKGSNIKNLD